MIKRHKQTKTFDRKTKRGNCFQTAVACLLCMDPEDVPNVEVLYDIPDYNWLDTFNVWLNAKGYLFRNAPEFRCYHIDRDDEVAAIMFEKEHGISVAEMQKELQFKYYMVSGTSPRNHSINHILIYNMGSLVHDTFPGEHEPLYLPEGTKAHTQFTFTVIEKM